MGSPAVAQVRPAAAADAAGIAAAQITVWREAYAGLVDAAHLARFDDPPARTARWETHLMTPGALTAVAVGADGAVVGFARAGPSRDDPPDPAWELQAIYLRAEHRGGGVADTLLRAVCADRAASLWTFTANARARAFYARHGFEPDGRSAIDPGTAVPEVRLSRVG